MAAARGATASRSMPTAQIAGDRSDDRHDFGEPNADPGSATRMRVCSFGMTAARTTGAMLTKFGDQDCVRRGSVSVAAVWLTSQGHHTRWLAALHRNPGRGRVLMGGMTYDDVPEHSKGRATTRSPAPRSSWRPQSSSRYHPRRQLIRRHSQSRRQPTPMTARATPTALCERRSSPPTRHPETTRSICPPVRRVGARHIPRC